LLYTSKKRLLTGWIEAHQTATERMLHNIILLYPPFIISFSKPLVLRQMYYIRSDVPL
jgi:hypothetical protein